MNTQEEKTDEEVNDMLELPSFITDHKLECIAIGLVALLVIVASLRYSTPKTKTDASTVEQSIDASTVKVAQLKSTPPKGYVIVECSGEFTFKYPSGTLSAIHRFESIEEAIEQSWLTYEYFKAEDKKKWKEVE